MNLEETEDMARYILDVREELGIPMVLVEHDMGLVMDLADRVLVVDFGQPVATGTPAEIQDRPRRHPRLPGGGEPGMTATTAPTGATAADPAGAAATTIATRVRDRARHTPHRVAMREKIRGVWQEVTWASCWDTVQTVAHGLLALGVEPGDRVAVLADNRREWLWADVATVAVRGVTVGLYPTNPAAEVGYLLAHSGARVLIAEDQEQVDKALAVLDDCPELRTVVLPGAARRTGPLRPSGAARLGSPAGPGRRAPGRAPRRAAGADGRRHRRRPGHPGLHLRHHRPAQGRHADRGQRGLRAAHRHDGGGLADPPPGPDDLVLSYLPLCHVAERVFTTWCTAGAGVQVNFAESIATVPANLREVQPTLLFGVPRIWEKILATVTIRVATASPVKRATPGSGCASPTASAPAWSPPAAGTPSAPGWRTRWAGCSATGRCANGSGCAGSATPPPAPPRSPPRCCASSWASGCRCTRSTG